MPEMFLLQTTIGMCAKSWNLPQGPVVLGNRSGGRVKKFSQLSQTFGQVAIIHRKETRSSVFRYFCISPLIFTVLLLCTRQLVSTLNV